MNSKSRRIWAFARVMALMVAVVTLTAHTSSIAQTVEPEPSKEADPVQITSKWAVGDQSKYKALAQVNGTMTVEGADKPTELILGLEMIVECLATKPVKPDTTNILINTDSATALIAGQLLKAPVSPQSTVTLDKTGKIINISSSDKGGSLSGMNVSSLMALILPTFPQTKLKTGDTWSSEAAVPAANSKLTVKYTLLGTEKLGAVDTARIKQTFELAPLPPADGTPPIGAKTTGEATSNFSLANGRLLKTAAQLKIDATNVKDSPAINANVKLDVSLLGK